MIDYRNDLADFDEFESMDFTKSKHSANEKPATDAGATAAASQVAEPMSMVSADEDAAVSEQRVGSGDAVAPAQPQQLQMSMNAERAAQAAEPPAASASRALPEVDFAEFDVPDFTHETLPSSDARVEREGMPSDSTAKAEEERKANARPAGRSPFVSVADLGGAETRGKVSSLLDPGFKLSLRPMRYPHFYERYRQAIANTWSVEEVDFTGDIADLRERVTPAQRHVIQRLVAFFATGDTIVANNLVLSLYKHLNAPEARLYLSRQLFEEAQHIQFYLTLLDAYLPSDADRVQAFAAIEHIPSIRRKADFCFQWTDAVQTMDRIENEDDARLFLQNLTAFAAGVEGLFFFGAFAYVYYLRSRGLFNGLATGTNWVFRDESMHMSFAFDAIEVIRAESPHLFDTNFKDKVHRMLADAVACEMAFAEDLLEEGVAGLSLRDMDAYLKNVADRRLENLGYSAVYKTKNPFDFMELQDVQEVTNFFERRVSSYQVGVQGDVNLEEIF